MLLPIVEAAFLVPNKDSQLMVGDAVLVEWTSDLDVPTRLSLVADETTFVLSENIVNTTVAKWTVDRSCSKCLLRLTSADLSIESETFTVDGDRMGNAPLIASLFFGCLLVTIMIILLYRYVRRRRYRSYQLPLTPHHKKHMSASYDRPHFEDDRQVKSMVYLNK